MSHVSHASCAQGLWHCWDSTMFTMAAAMIGLAAAGRSCHYTSMAVAPAQGVATIYSTPGSPAFVRCSNCQIEHKREQVSIPSQWEGKGMEN